MTEEHTEEEGKGPGTGTQAAGSMGSKVDPDFIPGESQENPNEKRSREQPEETGS